MARKNAYDIEYGLHGDTVITDSKGTWTAGQVGRYAYDPNGLSKYSMSLYFQADLNRLPKASPYPITVSIYLYHTSTKTQLKDWIKSYIGYVPEKHTISEIWNHFSRLRNAYDEEDEYYSRADREHAEAQLDHLYSVAVDRIHQEEQVISESERFYRNRMTYEKYLTKEEQSVAEEAQKILNGHSYVEPMSSTARTGHLMELNKRLNDAVRAYHHRKAMQREESLKNRLLTALDTDVVLRRAVAVVLECKKEIRTSDYLTEFGHRMFGYTSSLDEYRSNVFPKVESFSASYGMESIELRYLVAVGEQYLENGGMLPPAHADHERNPEKFYFNDYVHNGHLVRKIRRVGRRYLYFDGGYTGVKSEYMHFEKAPYKEPVTLEDSIYNEMARLHNIRYIPNAHLLPFEDVLKILSTRKQGFQPVRIMYRNKALKEPNPFKRNAYETIFAGLECLYLAEQMENLKALSYVSKQASLEQLREEFNRIRELHGFKFAV